MAETQEANDSIENEGFNNIEDLIYGIKHSEDLKVYDDKGSLDVLATLRFRHERLNAELEKSEDLKTQFDKRNGYIFKQLRIAARLDMTGKKDAIPTPAEIQASRPMRQLWSFMDWKIREFCVWATSALYDEFNIIEKDSGVNIIHAVWEQEEALNWESLNYKGKARFENFITILGSLVANEDEYKYLNQKIVRSYSRGYLYSDYTKWSYTKEVLREIADIVGMEMNPVSDKGMISDFFQVVSTWYQAVESALKSKNLGDFTDAEIIAEGRKRGLFTENDLGDDISLVLNKQEKDSEEV
jgi:hypothetical protein